MVLTTVRFSQFNASLNRNADGQLVTDLSTPNNAQAKTVAEIIQRNNPDVLLINEFDYSPAAVNLFRENYLQISQNGATPVNYSYFYIAPSNTGTASGFDLNNNGTTVTTPGASGYGDDAFGFGNFPGQFGMLLLSKYPIDTANIRTFQNFLWKDMPGNLLTNDLTVNNPATSVNENLNGFYSPEEINVLRLSSKSHWDVPITVNGETVHVLVSHPTPPTFDGTEDRNGKRNSDEIRFWADYITPGKGDYIYDDGGKKGNLAAGSSFVIMGDQNADPLDGDSYNNAIRQLLLNPSINTNVIPTSLGAPQQATSQGQANNNHKGNPAFDTADFADTAPGNLRTDYVLPSSDLQISKSEVYWPINTDPNFPLVGTFNPSLPGGFPSSDHRLIYADLQVGETEPGKTAVSAGFKGQTIFNTGFIPSGAAGTVNGQQVALGGLSGVTYDAVNNCYYAISDDRSSNARFYTFTLDPVTNAVTFTNVVQLKDINGNPFLNNSLDPEGIALTSNGTVLISSEGEVRPDLGASRVTNPFIKEFNLTTGQEIRSLAVPKKFNPVVQDTNSNGVVDTGDTQTSGVRNNLAFESLTITPDQKTLFTATESALFQDGAIATTTTSARSRIIQYNLVTGQPEKEYLYITDPIAKAPTGGTAADNGLVDLLAIDNRGTLLALERSFAVGQGNTIKIYEITLQGATDINTVDSLSSLNANQLAAIQPTQKRLLLNLDSLNLPNSDGNHPTGTDNIEGLAFGPKLADGTQSIVLVSDNNFGATQFTQILTLSADVVPTATPIVETRPALLDDDSLPFSQRADADDPAIYVNATDSSKSLVVTSVKNGGLRIYDLAGNLLQTINPSNPDIRYNNVDLQYGFTLGGEKVDIAVASDRNNDKLAIFKINPNSTNGNFLENITDSSAATIFQNVPFAAPYSASTRSAYGLAIYRSPVTNDYYVFTSRRQTGDVAQLKLVDKGNGKIGYEVVRSFTIPSSTTPDTTPQTEGMVADQETGFLYIGQEDVGIWKFDAEPNGGSTGKLIEKVKAEGGKNLTNDVEGLTIYYGKNGTGYLLASSQGDNTFAVYTREGNNDFLGRFGVGNNGGIDSVQESDGADVINLPLGPNFPYGVFITQDGANDPATIVDDENISSNFKLVPWENIVATLPQVLKIDTTKNVINVNNDQKNFATFTGNTFTVKLLGEQNPGLDTPKETLDLFGNVRDTNQFILQDATNPSKTVTIFEGPDGAGKTVNVTIDDQGNVAINGLQVATGFSQQFHFGLINNLPNGDPTGRGAKKYTFSTNNIINPDRASQFVTYSKGENVFVLGAEELPYANSNQDFDDMIVEINGIKPLLNTQQSIVSFNNNARLQGFFNSQNIVASNSYDPRSPLPQPRLTNYEFTNLPKLGTTSKGQDIFLGGFSGLYFQGIAVNGNLQFVTHTDRGPNGDPTGANRPFYLPDFQPEIVSFELNKQTGAITIIKRTGLFDKDGTTPLTGLPNLQAGANGTAYTDEIAVNLDGQVIANKALGADVEGIVIAPNGDYWLVDEYRPAIYNFDVNGKLLNRYIPQGTATALEPDAAAGTFGTEVLPAVYGQRRNNRGFEAVALEGSKLYAFIQSPIDNPDNANDTTSRNSRNLRILEFDIISKQVTGEYLYLLDNITAAGNAKTDKIGDAVSLGNGKFAVVERDDLGTNASNKLIYQINLAGATNINNSANFTLPAGKTIEQLTPAELTTAKITPVSKSLIANAAQLGYTGVEKLEGLALVAPNTLALINDNDFNVSGNTPTEKLGILELPYNLTTPQPKPSLNILLVNDDGYQAKGINVLYDKLVAAGHKVTLVAPKTQQSGQGTAIDTDKVFQPIEVVNYAPNKWYVDGKPVIATWTGLDFVVKQRPDLVISGINEGENLGLEGIISGTLSAAVSAVHQGVPSIAVSAGIILSERAAGYPSTDKAYQVGANYVVDLIAQLQAKQGNQPQLLPDGIGLNVNIPADNPITGIAFTEFDLAGSFDFKFGQLPPNFGTGQGILYSQNSLPAGATPKPTSEGEQFLADKITVTAFDGDWGTTASQRQALAPRLSLTVPNLVNPIATASKSLNILLVNDDGYQAKGIDVIYNALVAAGHNVILVAPKTQQSGKGTSINTDKIFQNMEVVEFDGAKNKWYVDGTPVVATWAGLDYILPSQENLAKPDLVISGINEGENVGFDAISSGTLSAAVTALQSGIPAIAVSAGINLAEFQQGNKSSTEKAYDVAARMVVDTINKLLTTQGTNPDLLPKGVGLNINVPAYNPDNASLKTLTGVALTKFDETTSLNFNVAKNQNGDTSILLGSPTITGDIESEGGKFLERNITITPIDGNWSASASSLQKVASDAAPLPVNGIASGDTTQTSTVLWARSIFPGAVKFEYSTNSNFSTIAGTQTANVTDINLPVKVAVSGLTPNTNYFYRVTDTTGATSIGKFSTAAAIGNKTGLKFGVSGDWRGELAPYPAVSNADDANLKFFVELGDTIYADVASPAVKNPDGTEKKQVITVDEYRAKQAEVYSQKYGENTLGDLRAATSILATVDDHEVVNDFQGGKDLATASSADKTLFGATSGLVNDSPLYETGFQAFQEYNPISDQFYGATGDTRTAGERKLYRYNTFGSDAATFVLDARSFRDPGLTDVANISDATQVTKFLTDSFNPNRTMLGKVQLDDLKRDLIQAQKDGITWKFIILPEPIQNLGVAIAADRYEGYAAERTEILKFINDSKISNVVFVTADFHGTLVNNLTYQLAPGQAQIPTSAFEIITGSVAYDAPFGPTVGNLFLTPEQKAFYNSLPVANDVDSTVNDRDDFIKQVVNGGINALGYDPIGLNNNLAVANGLIDAKLLQGDYVATHTYGWTEFNIDQATQKLTVTTYGIDPYTRQELEANPAAISSRQPKIVSQFEVKPNNFVDLELSQTANVTNAVIGDQVTFTLTLSNKGSLLANGIKVTDFLPQPFTLISATPEQGTYNSQTGVWDVGEIAGNVTRTLKLTAKVTQSGALTNKAEITAQNQPDFDSGAGNNNAQEDDQSSTTLNITSPMVTLKGFASLPADTFAAGPASGAAVTNPTNGRTTPFPGQPVQGFSGVQFAPNSGGSVFWFLADNGFGAKNNSADFLLRLYQVDPNFAGTENANGSVAVQNFIQLSDPNKLIPFDIVNKNTAKRELTGADFDVESFVIDAKGDIWVGDEFGTYLLHFNSNGVLLDAPFPTPNPVKLNTLNGQAPIVIGHRGASGELPEHTIEAYRLAILRGADFIEPDLVSTKDGVLIARHEPNLINTTDVASRAEFASRKKTVLVDGVAEEGFFASDFTLAEIKTLRAVMPQGFRDQLYNGLLQVPTLGEIIDLVKEVEVQTGKKIGIYPETKHPTYHDNLGLSLEEKLIDTLKAKGFTDPKRIFIQSFEVSNLKDLNNTIMPAAGVNLPLVQLLDAYDVANDGTLLYQDVYARPYDFTVKGDTRTYGDLQTPAGLKEIATYADGIGPWKRQIVSVKTVDNNNDGQPDDLNNDGVINDADKVTLAPSSLVSDAHKEGLLVHPYTFRNESRSLASNYNNNPELEYRQFISLGVDGYFTDFPGTGDLVRDQITANQVRSPQNPTVLSTPKFDTLTGKAPIVIGHRGASGERPEHTIEAYKLAIAQGADFIEPDLAVTKDGVLIARHEPMLAVGVLNTDGTIQRDTNGKPVINTTDTSTDVYLRDKFSDRLKIKNLDGRNVAGWFAEDFTLAEVKELNAIERIPALRGTTFDQDGLKVPTLKEVIDLVKQVELETGRKIGIYPETKHPTFFQQQGINTSQILADTLKAENFTDPSRVFIQSFEVANLKALKNTIMPTAGIDIPLVQLFGGSGRPYDFVVSGDTRTYTDISTPAGLTEIATYAKGIGPNKQRIIPQLTVDANKDGTADDLNGDGQISDGDRVLGTPTTLIQDAHKAGLIVHLYTLRNDEFFLPDTYKNDPGAEFRKFIDLGVDGFFTDFPKTGRQVLVNDYLAGTGYANPNGNLNTPYFNNSPEYFAPNQPYYGDLVTANLNRSQGFEGMAFSPDRQTIYPMLEGTVVGDPAGSVRIYKFDVASESYQGLIGRYQLVSTSNAIGDFTPINNNEFLVIERDNGQGSTALFKKIFKVDFSKIDANGFVSKEEVADLLNIQDPKDLNGDGKTTYNMPFQTIEDVLVIDSKTILVANDNNYPFSIGRPPGIDNNEMVVLELDKPLALDSRLGLSAAIAEATQYVAGITGNDDLFVSGGTDGINDTIFTGAGDDTVDTVLGASSPFAGNNIVDLGSGDDTIFVNKGDRAFGSDGNDIFDARDGQGGNRISGGVGDDTFYLGSNDRALGGDGKDIFRVSLGGGNLISGGAGADQFWIVNAELPSSANTVLDFQLGTDVIGIQGAVSLGITTSTLKLNQVGADTAIIFNNQTLATLTGIQASSLSLADPKQFVFA
ncbi:5'/3'-nucleotidase SurE [Dolichospermum sp. LEGE 00240]|uniref:5'/3'-nucleotidase SurE n=1 Tax=Dolichospermum sp. LEGE 00240 TaxID=1828603 RepID=UPI001D14E2AE|nr:5'/3'-nucleotidase SurE [Dolichospermum sp. LEGE 00240]